MNSDTSHLSHPDLQGVNPAFAVIAAAILSLGLVSLSYFFFNRSSSALAARNISLEHYAQRKARARNPDAVSTDDVTSNDITELSNQIDQTLKSVNQDSRTLQPDDLSDKALGLQ